ncbi:MAG: hypothetical protein WCQ54_06045 [Clostridiaceae bacterium]
MENIKKHYKVRPYSIAWFAEIFGEAAGLLLTIVGGTYFIIFIGY